MEEMIFGFFCKRVSTPSSRAAEQSRKSGAEQEEQRADGMFEKINIEKKKAGPSRAEQEGPSRAEHKQSGT